MLSLDDFIRDPSRIMKVPASNKCKLYTLNGFKTTCEYSLKAALSTKYAAVLEIRTQLNLDTFWQRSIEFISKSLPSFVCKFYVKLDTALNVLSRAAHFSSEGSHPLRHRPSIRSLKGSPVQTWLNICLLQECRS